MAQESPMSKAGNSNVLSPCNVERFAKKRKARVELEKPAVVDGDGDVDEGDNGDIGDANGGAPSDA